MDELKNIGERLLSLPNEILFKENELLALNRKILLYDNLIKDIERKNYTVVYFEKNNDGKNLFTNESLRESEVSKRSWADKEYNQCKVDEKDAIEKQHETRADVDKLKREFKSYEIFVELHKVRLRII